MISAASMFLSLALASLLYRVPPLIRWGLLALTLCMIAAWDGLLIMAAEYGLLPRVGFGWVAVLITGAGFILLGRADLHRLGGLLLRGIIGTALAIGIARGLASSLGVDPFASEPPIISGLLAVTLMVIAAAAGVTAVAGHAMAGIRGAVELSVLFGGGLVLLTAVLPGSAGSHTTLPVEYVIPTLTGFAGACVGTALSLRRSTIALSLVTTAFLVLPGVGYLIGLNLLAL